MMTLESNQLFCHLPSEALERLTEHARKLHFTAGEIVFRKGDAADGLYFLQSGEVQVTDAATPDGPRLLARFGPGEVFGEMAVLDGQPRSADASAVADCAVLFVTREEILCLLDESPELALKFLREISGRLRQFNRQQIA